MPCPETNPRSRSLQSGRTCCLCCKRYAKPRSSTLGCVLTLKVDRFERHVRRERRRECGCSSVANRTRCCTPRRRSRNEEFNVEQERRGAGSHVPSKDSDVSARAFPTTAATKSAPSFPKELSVKKKGFPHTLQWLPYAFSAHART